MAKNKTLELSIKIAGRIDRSLISSMTTAQSQISEFARDVSRVGTVGLGTMTALGVGTAKVLAECTDEASKFHSKMADVVKVVDGLADANGKITGGIFEGNGKSYAENYAQMADTILDLSTQIPYLQEDLIQLAAAAGQSGKSLQDLVQTSFIRDIAMWGTAMDITAQQAGDWGAKWEQAFGMTHEQVMETADVINYLGNNYATTAAEIASSVNDAAALGQLAGVDVRATAAMAASMQAMGVSSDKVGTTIKRIYTNITKGTTATKAQRNALAKLGFTATGIAEAMQADGAGTLLKVFQAVNNLPEAEKLSTLNALFGQWAIEGGAKVTQNLGLLTQMLQEVSDPNLWTGSMEKEFIIKATTPEAIDTMLESSLAAMKIDVGTAFLPAKKEFGTAMIDFIGGIRENVPELTELAGSLGKLASGGVALLGQKLDEWLPQIKSGLGWLTQNGDKVVSVIKGLAIGFGAMKLAPGVAGLGTGVWNLLFGQAAAHVPGMPGSTGRSGGLFAGLKSLFRGGQNAAKEVMSWGAAGMTAAQGNPVSGWLTGALSALGNMDGLSARGKKRTIAIDNINKAIKNVADHGIFGAIGKSLGSSIKGSAVGQYVGDIWGSMKKVWQTDLIQKPLTFGGNLLKKGAGAVRLPEAKNWIVNQAASGMSWLRGKANAGAGWLGGKAQTAAAVIGNSGVGRAAKAVGRFGKAGLGIAGQFGGSVLGLTGSFWKPFIGGFGSLLTGALPIVGVISTIIAVVSILGDNLESIRGIIGTVFGPQGLVIFDGFLAGLQKVGAFLTGLFAEGGVAKALSGWRESIVNLFGADSGAVAAFDGIVTVVQSVMSVIGQLVSFSNAYIKPILENIFGFIVQTVIPAILQAVAAAAPYISGIIHNIGSGILGVAQIIASAVEFAWPLIAWLGEVLLNVGQVTIPAVLAYFQQFAAGLFAVIENAKTIFNGLTTFLSGVFTGNWSLAWQGIQDIFGGAFAALVNLCKTPVNAVISLINTAIEGINSLGITIPEWVPVVGGKSWSINIPQLPMLAKGGFTNGVSIAGEAGTEAVISFQRSERRRNIGILAKAAQMLGVKPVELRDPGNGNGGGGGSIIFAPNIVIQGNADRAVIDEALARARAEFERWYRQMQHSQARTAY